uniref:Uncharacterized protein n=1 Tax=Octopus bimaculoides TaxID=37653 RepID=A0A0L8HQJ1_OCTBM
MILSKFILYKNKIRLSRKKHHKNTRRVNNIPRVTCQIHFRKFKTIFRLTDL